MALKQLLAIECPARVEIHEREIGVETSRNSTLPKQGKPARRDACDERCDALERNTPFVGSVFEEHGQSGLHAGNPAP